MKPSARQCTALRKDGRRCRAWALRDGDEALCASHIEASRQKSQPETGERCFYQDAFDIEEIAGLLAMAQPDSLAEELTVTRVAVRRALLQLQRDLQPVEYARLVKAIFDGMHTIAGIMRVQRTISAAQDDTFPSEVRELLKEISADKGWDL